MTTPTPFGRAARLADAIKRKGASITLRRLTQTAGPVPLVNPPRITNAVIDGTVTQGATVLALRADYAVGRLLAGDRLLAAGVLLTVTGPAASRPVLPAPGFAAVPISPAPVSIPDGTLVAFTYGADLDTFAMINSFPLRLVDGERIRNRDLAVTIAAYGLPDEIPPTWSIKFGARELSIVNSTPAYEKGELMRWDLQARS